MSTNIKTKVEKNKLTIEIDLSAKGVLSKSRKSLVIATTEGNQKVDGADVVLGLNCYRKNPDYSPE